MKTRIIKKFITRGLVLTSASKEGILDAEKTKRLSELFSTLCRYLEDQKINFPIIIELHENIEFLEWSIKATISETEK